MKKPAPRRAPRRGAAASGAVEGNAKAQLDGFFDKFNSKVAALGRKCFAHMSKRLPGAVSLVYDNYNALAIGFAPPGEAAPLSIALYPRWVNLFFLFGAGLPDPDGLLQGKGSRVRSIRINTLAELKDERVDNLISTAVMHRGWTLNPRAKNELVIQSISKNQRPRRPQ